jgi:hypothetical protein
MGFRVFLSSFYGIFFMRLIIGFATGISFSIYRLYYGGSHIWSFAISTVFMLVGLAIYHIIYMIFLTPRGERATRMILTQIAAHYIGSIILIV